MECETALSNETKTKELSFAALYHVVLEHLGPAACYGTVNYVHAFTHFLLTLLSTAHAQIYYCFTMVVLVTKHLCKKYLPTSLCDSRRL